MKKLLLCLLLLVSTAWTVSAQDKNILGVRAGFSMNNILFRTGSVTVSLHHRNSFHVGVVDQIRLLPRNPFYLEVGLLFNDAGTKIESTGKHMEAMYLLLPVALNYHFSLGKRFAIIPHLGLYYGVGVVGKFGKDPTFGKHGTLGRNDFGARFGVGATWREHYYLGVGFQGSILGMKVRGFEGTRARNRTINLTLGYNF